MKKYHKITPEGTKDLLFEECLTHRYVERTLAHVFASRGFHEVVTPGMEFYDVFHFDAATMEPERMYKMTDTHGRLLVMRPDSTIPIARVAATRLQNQKKPLRLYYTQHIYRSTPGLSGHSSEIMQSGIELIGVGGKRADLEVLVIAIEAMSKCIPDFRMELGHAGFFQAIAEQLPIGADDKEDIRLAIESKNYAALDRMLDHLEPGPQVDAMRRLPRLFGGEEVFDEAMPLCEGEKAKETLRYLKEIYDALSVLGLGDRILVDLGLVQRNDYYTNIVFSAYAEHYGEAILTGGRYDNLLASFDSPMPAVGFAMNVDVITRILMENGKGRKIPRIDVLVHSEEGYEIKGLTYAANLVEQNLRCENSVFATREETLEYARQLGVGRVDFVGETVETAHRLIHV